MAVGKAGRGSSSDKGISALRAILGDPEEMAASIEKHESAAAIHKRAADENRETRIAADESTDTARAATAEALTAISKQEDDFARKTEALAYRKKAAEEAEASVGRSRTAAAVEAAETKTELDKQAAELLGRETLCTATETTHKRQNRLLADREKAVLGKESIIRNVVDAAAKLND